MTTEASQIADHVLSGLFRVGGVGERAAAGMGDVAHSYYLGDMSGG